MTGPPAPWHQRVTCPIRGTDCVRRMTEVEAIGLSVALTDLFDSVRQIREMGLHLDRVQLKNRQKWVFAAATQCSMLDA